MSEPVPSTLVADNELFEHNKDSEKENEIDVVTLRGKDKKVKSAKESKALLKSEAKAKSKTDKVQPSSVESCEMLLNELNIGAAGDSSLPSSPHRIIRRRETNPFKKLKSSLTPKKKTSTKSEPLQPKKTSTNTQTEESKTAGTDTSHKVTDFFPIRRSERKVQAEIVKNIKNDVEEKLLADSDADLGIEVADIENKGRGVKTTKYFVKGEFVVEYAGPLVDLKTANDLEEKYSMDTSKGCYMYYFQHKSKQYCVDATAESGRYGRLLNHSRVSPNCVTKVVGMKDSPRLILVANQDIAAGTELLFDYGDRSKDSLKAHPWLAL